MSLIHAKLEELMNGNMHGPHLITQLNIDLIQTGLLAQDSLGIRP